MSTDLDRRRAGLPVKYPNHEGSGVLWPLRINLAAGFLPLIRNDGGKEGIARHRQINLGEIKPVHQRPEQAVDLAAADHRNVRLTTAQFQRLLVPSGF